MQSESAIVKAMLKPETYPEVTGEIGLIQTHISFVFLTDNYVYKVKKPVNFGFLDFSSLEKRRINCEKELMLNRRLCPEIYLEVDAINKSSIFKINGPGQTVEYTLKMKRLPQDRLMTCLLKEGKINKKTIDEIARIVAKFHMEAQTNDEIREYGQIRIIKTNWDENFSQTIKYINKTIPKSDFDFLQNKINKFIEDNERLFESRIEGEHIRDCHGDLHSGNIFVTEKICIFDAIEFNDRFRYSDAASDVAFLVMDLDFQGRSDLADYLISQYIIYSNDKQLKQLLPFYKCYRAYVRGKVVSFRLDDQHIALKDKEIATTEASAYFRLAAEYAQSL